MLTSKDARKIVEEKNPDLTFTGCLDMGDWYVFPAQKKGAAKGNTLYDCWRNVSKETGMVSRDGHRISELMRAKDVWGETRAT